MTYPHSDTKRLEKSASTVGIQGLAATMPTLNHQLKLAFCFLCRNREVLTKWHTKSPKGYYPVIASKGPLPTAEHLIEVAYKAALSLPVPTHPAPCHFFTDANQILRGSSSKLAILSQALISLPHTSLNHRLPFPLFILLWKFDNYLLHDFGGINLLKSQFPYL